MGWKWNVRGRTQSRDAARPLPCGTRSTMLPFVETEELGRGRPAVDPELGFGHTQFAMPRR